MKDIRPALRTFVLADGLIASMVGARMYPIVLPQGVKEDSIVYNEVSSTGDHHNEGPSGLAQVRMQIGCWSLSADGAHALGLAVKARIDGYRGPMGSVDVQGVFFETWNDLYEDSTKMFGKSADYRIWYGER
jgi:hypothetical protein